VNYTLATTALQFSNVGSYPITVTLGSNPNYSVTPTDGTLTVNQRPITVTADNKSKTYGDLNPGLTATVTGTVNGGDSVNYTLATTALQFSNVGSYPITVTLGSNPNYSVTPTNGTLTVTPAPLSITPDGGKSKTYGATFTAFTGVVVGLKNSDAVTVTYTSAGAPAAAGVGSYDITVAGYTFTAGSASNYTITTNTAVKGLTVQYGVCLNYDPTRSVKSGAAYPIKLYLCNASGANVSSPSIILNAFQVYQSSGFSGPPEDAGNANPDDNFRYEPGNASYIFNLKTTGLPSGTYVLKFNATGDPVPHSAAFGVK
jgi:hypothetical protein